MITPIGKFYLYRHVRLDTNTPFYIGVGRVYEKNVNVEDCEKHYARAFHKYSRNRFWKYITAKTEYEVQILLESDDFDFIETKEIEFISLYGRRDLKTGTLCNLAGGGKGVSEISEDERQRRSERMKGKLAGDKNPMFGRTGEAHHGFGIKQSEQRRKRQSEKMQGIGKNGENNSAKIIVNFKTKEERGCAKEVSDELGINHSTFCYMLRFEKFNVTDYMYKEDYDKGLVINELFNKKCYPPIIDTTTLELFSNSAYTAKILGISKSRMYRMLTGKRYNDSNYLFYDDYLKGVLPYRPIKNTSNSKPVIDIKTLEKFGSVLEAADFLSIKKERLRKMLSGIILNETNLIYLKDYTNNNTF